MQEGKREKTDGVHPFPGTGLGREQGKRRGKMQLENQSAGNFKNEPRLCYCFFDPFLMDSGPALRSGPLH